MLSSRQATAAAAALIALASPIARADVLPPNQSFNGLPQYQLAQNYWQLALSIPAASNPLSDPTGADASLGSQGPLFYVAGTTGTTATRQFTVLSNQSLFVPLLPIITWPDISAYQPGTYANLRRDDAETAGIQPNGSAPNTSLFLTLDGQPVPLPPGTMSLLDFRQVSPSLFNLAIIADNVFGVTGPSSYPGTFPAVEDGWYALLGPLSPGTHTLHFGGSSTGIGAYAGQPIFSDTTDTIIVLQAPSAVPEPATLLLWGAGLGGVTGLARWRKKRRGEEAVTA